MPVAATLRAWARRNGWLVAVAIAYLWCFPYYPRIHSANELPRVYLTRAILDEGTFAVDTGVAEWGMTVDVSPAGGHHYSNKAPGASFLAVPAYAIARAVANPGLAGTLWVCRVFAGVLPTLVFLWFLVGWLERITPDLATRRFVAIAYGLGSMAMTYSVLFYSHQLAAVCIAAAWMLAIDVADRKRGMWAMALAGFLAGYAPCSDYQSVFGAIPVAVHVIWKLRTWPRRELIKAIAVATAAALPPVLLLLGYHAVCFGSPFRTGYDASESFAHFHQHGFLGITALRWEAFVGSFLAPENGLLTLSPWLLLAGPGVYYLWRTQRDLAVASIAAILAFGLFICSINFWRGGWGVGPRYITALIPFALPLVCAAIAAWRDRPGHLAAAGALVLVGATVYLSSTATFPYWPEAFKNPLYDVAFQLIRDGAAAPNPIGGVGGLIPYFAIGFGVVLWALRRLGGWRVTVVALAVGVGLVAAYALFPRGHDLAHPYQFVHEAVVARGV